MIEMLTSTTTESIDQLAPGKLTPLHMALESGALDCCEALLMKGADVNVVDAQGNTTMHKAALGTNATFIHALISQWGATFDRPNSNGELPIHYAALRGDHETIELLASLKANLELPTPAGNRPLHIAASSGKARAVYMLLSLGVDPQPLNRANETPLLLATKAGAPITVKAILFHFFKRKVVAPSPVAARRLTPLHCAAANGNIECLVLLIRSRSIALDSVDPEGNTPLHHAVRSGSVLCAEALIRAGAATSIRNARSQTPADLAQDSATMGMLNLFTSNIAPILSGK
jgi:ankyrin repeat protein